MATLTVVGSLNMDMTFQVARLPQAGETILSEDARYFAGGKGNNQAVAAARMGISTVMIGAVGQDEFGQTLITNLAENQVKADLIEKVPAPTGQALITVDQNGDNTIVLVPGANYHVTPKMVERYAQQIADSDALLLQLEIPLETAERAVQIANQAGVPVFLNAAPAMDLPEELLKQVTYLIVNETEASFLLGRPTAHLKQALKTAQELCELGPEWVIITLGKEGAVLANSSTHMTFPGYTVDVIDTTGAGDAFVGAFIASVIEMQDCLEAALDLACASGAAACAKLGAQSSLPTIEMVRRIQQQQPDGV